MSLPFELMFPGCGISNNSLSRHTFMQDKRLLGSVLSFRGYYKILSHNFIQKSDKISHFAKIRQVN
jgi:hypothetical protein